MRNALLTFCFLCTLWSATAQKLLARIPARNANNVQFFEIGDSLLLIYSEQLQVARQQIVRSISPDGVTKRVYIPDVDGALVNIVKKGNDAFLYFIKKEKKIESALVVKMTDGRTGSDRIGVDIPLRGTYVGSFNAEHLHLVSFDKETEEFILYIIDGTSVREAHAFYAPGAQYHFANNRVEFFDGPRLSPTSKGIGTLKVVREGDVLYISTDDVPHNKTKIISISLTDFSSFTTVIEHEKINPMVNFKGWATFPSHGSLYVGYISLQVINLAIYDLRERKLIYETPLDVQNTIGENAYLRNVDKSIVSAHIKFRWEDKPALVVANENDKTRLRIGSYRTASPVVVIPGPTLAAAAIGSMIFATISNYESSGIGRYVYLDDIGNPHRPTLSIGSEGSKSQLIDEFDAAIKHGPQKKFYSRTGVRYIGIYKYKESLDIYEF